MKRSSRHLTRPFDLKTEDFSAVWDEVAKYPPRASVIIAAAFLEDALRWAIEQKLVDGLSEEEQRALFEAEGAPLSSFHGKILLGHAIGIYGQVAKADLLTVKRIRNAFAHSPRSIDFATPEIVSECTKLRYLGAISKDDFTDPKLRCRQTIVQLVLALYEASDKIDERGMP
jgi:hypothetical protein